MEPPFNADGHTKAGTAGGTLLVVLLQVSGGEVVKTIVLAAIGAAVSFVVSLALKWGLRRLRRGEPLRQEKELRGEKRRRRIKRAGRESSRG